MKLKNFLPHLSLERPLSETEITGISCDSRLVNRGDVFFVINRKRFDIFSVLKAVEPRVRAFVVSSKDKGRLRNFSKPVIPVKNAQNEFSKAADLFYGFKKGGLKFIGITGTNGKTTTACLIYHLLKKLGQKPALIGTVCYRIGAKSYPASYTTPDFLSLRKLLAKARDSGSRFVVMEVSSHAIAQERIRGIQFSRCLFTNLSRDHLDYHRTMESYFRTKKKLFLDNPQSISLINTDGSYGRRIFKAVKNAVSFGINPDCDLRAINIKPGPKHYQFDLEYRCSRYPLRTSLLGRHNILNILGAVAAVHSLGFSLERIAKFIPSFKPVEGRLEPAGKDIFVDYAHTPDALKSALGSLKEAGYGKIICVFGCGGQRDRGKRKLMGRVAHRRTYFTFITSDNPRGEDPLKICSQIQKGFCGRNFAVIIDRKKAIAEGVRLLRRMQSVSRDKRPQPTVCLLVAGKGHENYQIIGNKRLAFKDSRAVKECLEKGRNSTRKDKGKRIKFKG